MKTRIRAFVFFCTALSSFSQQPNFQWAKQIGGSGLDEGYAVTTDQAGNVYATGSFDGTVDFDPGPGVFNLSGNPKTFIVKLDASGSFIWAKNTNAILSNAITVDASGNVYTTGRFGGVIDFDPGAGIYNLTSSGLDDIFILKLDALGNFIWAKNVGGSQSGDQGLSIKTDASGNIYTTGNFTSFGDFDPGMGVTNLTPSSTNSDEIFILKLDMSGNFVWAKSMGSIGNDYGFSIAIDAAQSVYTTGFFGLTADFDPGPSTYSLAPLSNNFDVFISKLDINGDFVWAKQLGTNSSSTNKCSLTIDGSSNVYVTGLYIGTVDFDPGPTSYTMTANGNTDIFILKIDGAGNFNWVKNMGGISSDGGISIALDGSNNIYTTGYFFGTADFDPGAATFTLASAGSTDIFVSQLDPSGNFGWAVSLGGVSTDYVNCIASDATGNVYITSGFSGTVDFDPGPNIFNLADNGAADVFVFKMHQQPLALVETSNYESIITYPNPTKDVLNIENDFLFENTQLKITDLLGRIVYETELTKQINIKELKPGIYFLQVYDKEKLMAIEKIIKE